MSTDALFLVLKNDRRRATIRFVADRDEPVTLSDVATHVADAESAEGGSGSYRSTYVSLQQSHVPVLEEHGVFEYDPESKLLTPGPQFGRVVDYLSEPRSEGTRLRAPELAVAVGGILLLLLGQVGVLPLGEGTAVAVLTLLAIAAVALARALGWLDDRGG